MSEHKIDASKVTKPIQLLAAWLAGLIIINGSFLTAAARLDHPDWATGLLVVSSVLNVPIFLVGLFLLQTKFRPEMQEDEFYSKYLEKRYSSETRENEVIEMSTKTISKNHAIEFGQPKYSSKNLPKSEFNDAFENPTVVHVNDLLPSFEAITNEFLDNDIEIAATFGSTASNPEVPSEFHLSFGKNINVNLLKSAIAICNKHGLESISYSTAKEAEGKIYIGSFGFKNKKRKVTEVTNDLITNITENNMTLPRVISLLLTKGVQKRKEVYSE